MLYMSVYSYLPMAWLLRQFWGAPQVSSHLARFTPQSLLRVSCGEGRRWENEGRWHRHGGSHRKKLSRTQLRTRQKRADEPKWPSDHMSWFSLRSLRAGNQELSRVCQAGAAHSADNNSFIINSSSSKITYRDQKPAGDISAIIDLALSRLVFSSLFSSDFAISKHVVLRCFLLVCEVTEIFCCFFFFL